MSGQVYLQHALQKEFAQAKARNSLISLRAFSQRIGMNSGIVSSIMSGKRKVSAKTAKRIAGSLNLDPSQRARILSAYLPRLAERKTDQSDYLKISADSYRAITDWYHFAILSLIKLKSFQPKESWIAARLGISAATTKQALSRLERIGMIAITRNEKGEIERIARTAAKFSTSDDIRSEALRAAHSENLNLAAKVLVSEPVETRDYSAMTLAFDSKKIGEAKELIRRFQDELAELVETSSADRVYKLCVQLFPLSSHSGAKK